MFQNLKSAHFQPSELPPMEGGIDYVKAEAVIKKTNAKLYEELVYLLKVKQEMGASLHIGQDQHDYARRHLNRMNKKRRMQYGNHFGNGG